METSGEANNGAFNPKADLDLLDKAKSSVSYNDLLDFGPWWYAPLLATSIAGLTLFRQSFGALPTILLGVAGFASAIFAAVHDYRRRTVRPKKTLRSTAALAAITLIAFAIASLWDTAVSSIGYEDFVPGYAVAAWLLTTAFFLIVRFTGRALLNRRTLAV